MNNDDMTIEEIFSRPKSEVVYLLQSVHGFKIGRSKDVVKRISQIKSANPSEITLILTLDFRNCVKQEKWIHNKFKEKKISGEWFDLSPDDYEWLIFTFKKYLRTYQAPNFGDYPLPKKFSNKPTKYREDIFRLKSELKKEKKRNQKYKDIFVPFGKYKGKKLWYWIKRDPDYFKWCLENFNGDSKKRHSEFFKNVEHFFSVEPIRGTD